MGYFNPLLRLPAARKLMALPAEQRAPLEALMRELRADADRNADESWRKRKGPMAAYWRAVSTYARHVAHALSKGHQVTAGVASSGEPQPPAGVRYTWPPKSCPCGSVQRDGCEELGCKWERDPSLVPMALRATPGTSEGQGREGDTNGVALPDGAQR
jgi:hypothetical protein